MAPAAKFEIYQIFLSFEAPKRTEFTVIREIGNIQGHIDGTGYLSLVGTITIKVDEDGIVVAFEPKFESKKKDLRSDRLRKRGGAANVQPHGCR
ncbi:hypothetical protein AB0M20_24435 [Actinoplanes sp. NPDC051633]|uniref:hypothetical protein n=1 Tax=Actinoplanes sp. NPDC051633 TaxID=3155670 RepID=UPI00342C81DC